MSNELAVRAAGGLSIQSIDELARVADMFAKSGLFKDAQDAAKAGVKIMAGQAWGIDPFSAMTGINIIAGKPAIGAHLMAAKIKGSGKYDYRVRDMNEKVCSIEFFQGGESIGVSTFTIENARTAGTQNLAKFPRNMLFARAMSNGQRWFCPDVFTSPTYTPEELGAAVDGDGNVIEAQVVSRPAPESRQMEAPKPAPEPVRATVGNIAPIGEGDGLDATDVPQDAPWEGESQPAGEQPPFWPPAEETEPLITAAQLKAVHTRLTKLGFNGKQADKDLAREFIGHMVGRALESSKDLTRTEAGTLLDLDDDTLAAALDSFRAEREMPEEEA